MQRKWLGEPVYTRLVTNGFSMSGTAMSAQRYMRYFVYWPMAVHRGPLRNVLVICYGVGVTAGAARDIPGVETIDVVDVSADVVAMSDVIYPADAHPLHDPRVRVHIEDGRQFLQATERRFDLITGEPPPPRTPGAVNIYTREYFQLMFDRLADGGIATYWLPVGRPDPGTNVNAIVAAFCEVFADCSLWNATPFDLMLAGTRGSLGPVAEDDFVRPWTTAGLRTRLTEIGLELPQQVGATFLGDAAYLRELTKGARPLVDDYPHRLLPNPRQPSLSDPGYGTDPAVTAHYQTTLDPARAQRAFESSAFIRRVWPERADRGLTALLRAPADPQHGAVGWRAPAARHRVAAPAANGDAAPHAAALAHEQRFGHRSDRPAARRWQRRGDVRPRADGACQPGLPGASDAFAAAEQRGLAGSPVRALRALALALSRRTDEAIRLAPARHGDDDDRRFWSWLESKFGGGP